MSPPDDKTRPHVYLTMPCYGHPHPTTAKRFWQESLSPTGPYRLYNQIKDDRGHSLLGHGFDELWANALNMQADGWNVTRFAMLHSDVVPPAWWLDVLLDDLDATGADVVAALVPIKDTRGLTSTALDDPNDPWDVLRRLTTTEAAKLPEVFSAADCGYPENLLLANTGCWVCDFTKPWRHARAADGSLAVNFEIRNSILPQPDGHFAAKVRPEDWEFSRKVGRLGGKVLVSRRLALRHMGEFPFPSEAGWGRDEADASFVHKHQDQAIKADVPSVDGWLTESEGRYLAELAAGRRVLEIGSYCGLSTIWMARTAQYVQSVDPHDGRGTPKPRNTLGDFYSGLRRYGVLDKVTVTVATAQEAIGTDIPLESFDLVFVDGCHDRASVLADLEVALQAVRPGGLLAFHDALTPDSGAEIRPVLDYLLEHGYETASYAHSILTLRSRAATTSRELAAV